MTLPNERTSLYSKLQRLGSAEHLSAHKQARKRGLEQADVALRLNMPTVPLIDSISANWSLFERGGECRDDFREGSILWRKLMIKRMCMNSRGRHVKLTV